MIHESEIMDHALAVAWPSGSAISQVPGAEGPAPIRTQRASPQVPSELRKIPSELQDLQFNLSAREKAQGEIKRYLEIIVLTIGIIAFFGIFLQVIAFRVDAVSRRQRNPIPADPLPIKNYSFPASYRQLHLWTLSLAAPTTKLPKTICHLNSEAWISGATLS